MIFLIFTSQIWCLKELCTYLLKRPKAILPTQLQCHCTGRCSQWLWQNLQKGQVNGQFITSCIVTKSKTQKSHFVVLTCQYKKGKKKTRAIRNLAGKLCLSPEKFEAGFAPLLMPGFLLQTCFEKLRQSQKKIW